MKRMSSDRRTGGSSALHILAALAVGAAALLTACQSGEQAVAEAALEDGAEASTSGSAVHEQPENETFSAASMEVGYTCADDKSFSILFAGEDQIHITIDGEMQILTRDAGHTGLLFSSDDVVFYSKGREASVEVGGEPTFTDCVAEGHPE